MSTIRLDKKDWIIFGLVILFIVPFIGNAIYFSIPKPKPIDNSIKLIYGTIIGPSDLDPMDAWDSSSLNVQDQVCEGLFGYNYTDPEMSIIPVLAKDIGIWNLTGIKPTYTIELRDDVWFHDGTKFDAAAAKWNFERLAYFMNHSFAKAGELFLYYDPEFLANVTTGEKGKFFPIINQTVVIDKYVLQFICNIPYGPFEALLCFNAAYMLSPTSTPFDKVIDTATGDLVGTGPFVYDSYKPGVEVRFHAWNYYWRARSKIDKLIFSVINDAQSRNNALLNGEIDVLSNPLPSMSEIFKSNPSIELYSSNISTKISYLKFNNKFVNLTIRKAISYAINYSNIFQSEYGNRLMSPIPLGIRYANWSYNPIGSNVSNAREIMQDMGFGLGWNTTYPGSDDNLWESSAFFSLNFSITYLSDDMFSLVYHQLKHIGIQIDEWKCLNCGWFICPDYDEYDRCLRDSEIGFLTWIPDYNDPSNYINPLFTNRSSAINSAHYNGFLAAKESGRDPFYLWDNVQLLMERGILEINQTIRKNYYNRIQEILVEEDLPWVYLYVDNNYDAWNINLKGYPSNPMDKVYFYPCYWENIFKS